MASNFALTAENLRTTAKALTGAGAGVAAELEGLLQTGRSAPNNVRAFQTRAKTLLAEVNEPFATDAASNMESDLTRYAESLEQLSVIISGIQNAITENARIAASRLEKKAAEADDLRR